MVELISDKEVKKAQQELIALHKRCLLNYLIQKDLSAKNRRRFFIVYDYYITTSNIREYFPKPLDLFVKLLILGRLEEIKDFKKCTKKALRASKKGRNIKYV